MWALILVMLLPTGQAVGEDEIRLFPTEETCIWAGADRGPAFREAIAQKAGIPAQSIKPIATCSKIAGQDV